MRLTNLAQVLRDAGLTVIEVPGWRERGKNLRSVSGCIWHHTATGPGWSDGSVVALLRDGRSDLAGPLAQLGLARDGTYYVIAAGRANHNGYGTWGNQTIGIEAFNTGTGEPWPKVQVDSWVRGAAALGRHYRIPVHRQLGHKETDPRRKIDPHGIDMADMRARVANITTPTTGGFLMSLTDAQQEDLYRRVKAIDLRSVQQQRHSTALLARTASIWAWTRVLVEVVNGGRLGALRADLHARAKALIGSAPDR